MSPNRKAGAVSSDAKTPVVVSLVFSCLGRRKGKRVLGPGLEDALKKRLASKRGSELKQELAALVGMARGFEEGLKDPDVAAQLLAVLARVLPKKTSTRALALAADGLDAPTARRPPLF